MTMLRQLIFMLFLPAISIAAHKDMFRQVDSSVQLDIWSPKESTEQFDDLSWIFDKNTIVMKYHRETNKTKLYPPYERRAEYNEVTHGLILKDLHRNDSGSYSARISGARDMIVSEYMLYVLEPVETPVLTPVPHQQSKDPCNVTVFCRGHDLSVSFGCYNYTCEESKVRSHGDNTIELYFQDKSIICNHSNAVSWNESIIEMNELCSSEVWLWPVIASVAATVILLLLVIGFFALCKWGKTADEEKSIGTLPAQPGSSG
ncbi:uncharacterized protein LOC113568111 isoform X1 [Electrophorus electricus]|uniref:uncharacterized protein LOC113568111 isoform X1 n=1 Tax=Electrophorus electricus TaxID=8005 RepID=UPI0015CFC1AB|nr:uncharacterized protein LOC113568111 isoform X1 [Electrophorus electricus]